MIRETKVGNDLAAIVGVLEPHRAELEGVAVESTFNWYWLVDGLLEAHRQGATEGSILNLQVVQDPG